MSVVLDSRAHAVAVKVAVDASIGPIPGTSDTRVYDYDEVPGVNGNDGVQPRIYAVVSIERVTDPHLRLSAQTRTGWRVAVRANGMTVDEVRWVLLHVGAALNDESLTIAGKATTPIQFESDEAPQYDDGRFTAVALYVYVH